MDGSTPTSAPTPNPTPTPDSPLAHLSSADLEAQITELAGQLNAATYRWLTLIAEFDRRNGWADGLLKSCAHWLNFKVGLNLGAAREKVRVAHALAGVPKIAAAMARGHLSYSKVRALTRVASAATEETLLMIALYGTAHHVETVVRYFRQVEETAALSREAQQQATRAVDYWYDADGSLVLKARLPALAGAVLVQALERALKETPATELNVALAEERPLAHPARRADALALVAESYLQGEAMSPNTADRHQVVLHVDAETLRESAPGRCHLEDGPALPVATLRRLTCDASLVRITESADGEPLDVGRKTRTIPPAIRRALHARDPGCCFPGCTAGRSLDAHHVEHWADGGATKLSNLVSLCRHHHRLVHEGGILVEARAGGGWRFRRPDGRDFEVVRPEPAPDHHWTRLQETHDTLGIRIDANTAATRWSGERLDYHLAIPILCAQAGIPAPVCGPYGAGGVTAAAEGSATAAATTAAPRRVSAATRVSAGTSADTDPTESPEDWDGDDGMSYWNGTEWVPYDD
jgi:hypothetical protein